MAGNKELGLAIARARDAREMTQTAFARLVGLHQNTFSNYEGGKNDIPTDVLARIARALGKSTDELLGIDTPEDQEFTALSAEWKHLEARQKREIVGLARVMHFENDLAIADVDLSGLTESEIQAVMESPADVRPMVADTMRRLREIDRVKNEQAGKEEGPSRLGGQGQA